ncbi:unnamed protein product, partial [Didymodactylos carnosus]
IPADKLAKAYCQKLGIDEHILWEIIDKASKQTTLARAIIRQKYLKNFHENFTTEIVHQAKPAGGYTDAQINESMNALMRGDKRKEILSMDDQIISTAEYSQVLADGGNDTDDHDNSEGVLKQ